MAPHPCSQPAFGQAVGRARRPWLSCAGRGHRDRWRNARPGQERHCTSSDVRCRCHHSCPAPCLGDLTLQSPRHVHPTAAGLREILHPGNRDPHHTPELLNTPAEQQRCRSCPKGPRAPKCRLRPQHWHGAPPRERKAPGSLSASVSRSKGHRYPGVGSTAEPDAPGAALGAPGAALGTTGLAVAATGCSHTQRYRTGTRRSK